MTNSPIPELRTMSSPKLLNALSTRWVVSGTSGFLSMLRKKMRTRTDTLPSSVKREEWIVGGEGVPARQGVEDFGILDVLGAFPE